MNYRLISDNDGHWYVIEENLTKDFLQWVDDTENNLASEFDFEYFRVKSPNHIRFKDYEEV